MKTASPRRQLIALDDQHIAALDRIAGYIEDSEMNDWIEQDRPSDHLIQDAILLRAIANIAREN
jgi:hypothetical protein